MIALQDTSASNSPILIVDTNIFGNLLDKKTKDKTLQILQGLNMKYQLSISKITIQEIIAIGTNEVEEIRKVLQSYKRFSINTEVLIFAGLMTCCGVGKNIKNKGQGDAIIASTAFLNSALILTANSRDFPEPFFTETEHWNIEYKDNSNRTACLLVHLLSVDTDELLKKINSIEYVKTVVTEK